MKRSIALLSGLALVAALPSMALAQNKTLTFGAALQLTGALANTARYYRDGYQLAVDKINQQGGIKLGGQSYTIALKILDSQSDVNLGVREYVQLITGDKVDFLLGPYNSNDALDDSSVAEKYQTPMVQGGGASSQIFTRGYKYIFGTLPPAEEYFGSTVDMMTKLDPKPKTVALLAADDSFDVSVAKGTRDALKKDGFDIAVDQQTAENSGDYTSVLSLVKSKNPDVILWSGHETQALNFIREQKSLNVSPGGFAAFTVGVPTADFRKALGKDSEYAFGMTSWLPSPLLKDDWFGDAQQFATAYQQKYGYAPDYHAASAVAVVETFVKAIEAAGSTDHQKVRDAIAKSDFASLYAQIRFKANGQINLPQTVIQIQDDKVVPIYTDHFLNKPRYPVPAWNKR